MPVIAEPAATISAGQIEITRAQLEDIAKTKMEDLNANDIDAAVRMIAGTARSMGIVVAGTAEAKEAVIVDQAELAAMAAEKAEDAGGGEEAGSEAEVTG